MLSLTGGLGEGAAEAVTAAAGAFMAAAEAFTARVGSQAFTAGVGSAAFTGGALGSFTAGVSGSFTGAILGAFTVGVSGSFAAIAVFSAVIDFSFPVSMATRGGGIGVIPIIGVIRITAIIRITPIRITPIRITLTSSQITRAHTIVTTRTSTSAVFHGFPKRYHKDSCHQIALGMCTQSYQDRFEIN